MRLFSLILFAELVLLNAQPTELRATANPAPVLFVYSDKRAMASSSLSRRPVGRQAFEFYPRYSTADKSDKTATEPPLDKDTHTHTHTHTHPGPPTDIHTATYVDTHTHSRSPTDIHTATTHVDTAPTATSLSTHIVLDSGSKSTAANAIQLPDNSSGVSPTSGTPNSSSEALPPPTSTALSASKGSKQNSVLLGVLIPLFILIALVTAFLVYRRRRLRRRPYAVFEGSAEKKRETDLPAAHVIPASERLPAANATTDSQHRNSSDSQLIPSQRNSTSESGLQFHRTVSGNDTTSNDTSTPSPDSSSRPPTFLENDPFTGSSRLSRYPSTSAPTFVTGDWPRRRDSLPPAEGDPFAATTLSRYPSTSAPTFVTGNWPQTPEPLPPYIRPLPVVPSP
ncbi:hypothetical protein B0H19DRAFT_1266928 [Mycena capillaripes]|nr:hypothetical protein B0H19DRAFT_1266928 [Mycena capillaripes]